MFVRQMAETFVTWNIMSHFMLKVVATIYAVF